MRTKARYYVNYGQTPSSYLRYDKPFISKRAAIRDCVRAIRELGAQAWAAVYDGDKLEQQGEYDHIAYWRGGRRVY